MDSKIHLEPIGIVHSALKYRYETSRQGILAKDATSVIELMPNRNFEQALKDLEGFDRIWVVFLFHLNPNWKPMVTPPRHTRKKVGLFATRSPHRPNQIGLSCVRLNSIDGLKIHIGESDILDGSPVLDIKPYLPYSDSFPDARTGWVKNGMENLHEVAFEDTAIERMSWLQQNADINLKSFAKLQLEFNPADNSRKRISVLNEGEFSLAYRTWRIIYRVDNSNLKVTVLTVLSGYTAAELADLHHDMYVDKTLHNAFITQFPL